MPNFPGTNATYCSSVKYAAVTAWAAGASITAGAIRRQLATPTLYNERCFVAIVGGTTGGTEPTWDVSRGHKTTDNTVTWQETTGVPAVNGDAASTPVWLTVKNKNIDLGHIIKDAGGTHFFICSTTSGATGNGSEPTWNTSAVGNTTTDNNVTWTYIGTSFTAWGAPHARSRNMTQGGWGDGFVNKFYIGSDNNETQSTDQIQWSRVGSVVADSSTNGPVDVMCVNVAGSLPPVSADLTNTAVITASGQNLAPHGFFRTCYGINFFAGNGIYCNDDGGIAEKHYENCTFNLVGGGGGHAVLFTSQGSALRTRLTDCTFKFSGTGQIVFATSAAVIIENCSVDGSGSIPSTFLQMNSDTHVVFKDCDLSALSGTTLCDLTTVCNCEIDFIDCKFPSSYTLASFTGGPVGQVSRAVVSRGANSAKPYWFEIADNIGHLTTDITVGRTGGASDGTNAFSWKVITTNIAYSGIQYFECPPWTERNGTTGADVTATMYGVINAAALPTNAEIYMDLEYQGASGHTQSTRKSNRVADWLATPAALTADTSAWDANATARINSHAYSVGDVMAVSSNSGRVFFCTSAGTSASSLPGGYASAVDGGSVTDGTATFRAGMRFKMTVVMTSPQPQQVGNVYATAYVAKPSITVFLDPQVTLT